MPNDSSDSAQKTNARESNCPVGKAEAKREGITREKEIGGTDGPDPTRYGDWEKNGRCVDF
jgi:hypothetical protein